MVTDIVTERSQAARSLACLEVWGGNGAIEETLELPGLSVWLHSRPLHNVAGGGDVYYLSSCSHGVVARVALADVSGHGECVSELAQTLRGLMHRYVSYWDQTEFMQELNRAFAASQQAIESEQGGSRLDGAKFATSTVMGYYCEERQLLMTNAGHLPALHYDALEKTWRWLDEEAPSHRTGLAGLPLGLIPGTKYSQTAFQLGPGDLVVLYTDALTETVDDSGEELGTEGLMCLAQAISPAVPAEVGPAMLRAVHRFGAAQTQSDDETLIVFQCSAC
jgi:phosphoserine phosphatase RsbU/P